MLPSLASSFLGHTKRDFHDSVFDNVVEAGFCIQKLQQNENAGHGEIEAGRTRKTYLMYPNHHLYLLCGYLKKNVMYPNKNWNIEIQNITVV